TWNTLPCQDRFVTAVSLPCRGSCGYTASVIAMKPVGVTAGPRGSVSGINAQEPLIRPGSGDPDPASDHLGPRGERQHAGTRRVPGSGLTAQSRPVLCSGDEERLGRGA